MPWSRDLGALGSGTTIHTFGALALGRYSNSTIISSLTPTANRAYFVPFRVAQPEIIRKLFVGNGSAVSGNVDVGVYDKDGTRLVSAGSTAQSGTTTLQVFDVTDTLIGPGQYYLACALSNTTGRFLGKIVTSRYVQAMGCAQQDTAFALPATATFAAYSATILPVIGVVLARNAVV